MYIMHRPLLITTAVESAEPCFIASHRQMCLPLMLNIPFCPFFVLFFFFALFSASGSSCLFSALLTKCSEKNVFALCRCVTRRNYPPRFAALVPQKEVLDEGKVQITAPGAPSEAFEMKINSSVKGAASLSKPS